MFEKFAVIVFSFEEGVDSNLVNDTEPFWGEL